MQRNNKCFRAAWIVTKVQRALGRIEKNGEQHEEYNLEGFERVFTGLESHFPRSRRRGFLQYYEAAGGWNSFMNLTAITEFDQVI